MRCIPLRAVLGALLVISGCSDSDGPAAPTGQGPSVADVFARYVALGTSNSMGVQSAGIFAAGQQAAWTAELARRAGARFSLPLVQDPGCGPPLTAPLASDLALIGTFGTGVIQTISGTCAPLRPGITLPTNSVAISGANVHDALTSTPESEAAKNPRTGALYSRVLAPGQTQVSAMLAQNPTFVSVELAANEVLPASTGRIEAMTPYAEWERDFDAVLAAVKSTGARAVLVGLPANAANFPSVRTAKEFFTQAAALRLLGITVASECGQSSNLLFVPGYLLTLLARAPATATCADVPGDADYVLTASDVSAINARMAQMNARIQSKANENGYAYFSLDAVYGLAKPTFSVTDLLGSSNPFGTHISLDGVHPSTAGQSILASAAVKAIDAKYGLVIP